MAGEGRPLGGPGSENPTRRDVLGVAGVTAAAGLLGAVPSRDALGVTAEEYLLGLADLAGELARRAVLAATKQDTWEVTRIHDLLQALYGKFIEYDFRNGELRRKFDSIKYQLQKVEEVRYDNGFKLLRMRIREARRFTIIDLDHETAQHWGELLARWGREQAEKVEGLDADGG